MYTQEEVKELLEVFERQRVLEEQLESFCQVVAEKLGFNNGVTRVSIMEDEVSFTAEWRGAYQSYDSEHFCFPTKMLTGTQDQVFQYLDAERKKKEQDIDRERIANKEKEERDLLASLKKKYE